MNAESRKASTAQSVRFINVGKSYGNVRAGFNFYNDESDLDRLVEGLRANRELLA